MKFRFPVVIIDEDFRSENSERARRSRARQGDRRTRAWKCSGSPATVTFRSSRSSKAAPPRSSSRSTTRNSAAARRQRRIEGQCQDTAHVRSRRSASAMPTSRSTCTAKRARRATSRTTSCASCTASSTCSRTRRSSSRATSSARRVPTSTGLRRRFSARWCITRRTAPIRGIAPATPAASRS